MSRDKATDWSAAWTDSLKAPDDAAGSGDDVRPLATQTPNDHDRLASATGDQGGIAGAPKLHTEPRLPARDATVNQVREWIVATLVTNHKQSPEFARQISLKWELRRGWCLRELRPAEFLEMFGSIGPHLEWDVKYGMEEELAASNAKMKHASDAASRKVIGEKLHDDHHFRIWGSKCLGKKSTGPVPFNSKVNVS
ncbi:hypothetical protein LMH87_005657 [Akanthomyces muscarius]|uniref:Uncharacterized protein n=1 Tax=Akanthomyces muscarius TaxID=2231603 RepID=A0A9W8QLT3_AKAMU|nr:hypothetical protein LMH87_005657 [Akanthomyces muscarius]KAJ4163964.1 hypothetical protein LMH87_005657 [Akanthomyces muscarius]